MTTARQIAGNRKNARNSTGPRTRNGKKASSKNAYRHGLSTSVTSIPALEKHVERLAQEIAKADRVGLADARAVAAAEHDIRRVQRVKTALIDRFHVFGAVEPQLLFRSLGEEVRYLQLMMQDKISKLPEPPDPSATMPPTDPERLGEAMLRSHKELLRLDRYERRAIARRNRAIQRIIEEIDRASQEATVEKSHK
jgi:hypothetical protein